MAPVQVNVITLPYLFILCGGDVCECILPYMPARVCVCACVCVCVCECDIIVYACAFTQKDISISSEY